MQNTKIIRKTFQVRDYHRHLGRRKGVFSIPKIPPCCPLPVLPTGQAGSAPCTVGLAAKLHSSEDSASSNYMVYCSIIHPTLSAPATACLPSFPTCKLTLQLHTPRSYSVLSHLGIPWVSVSNMRHFNYTFRNSILNSYCPSWPRLYHEPGRVTVNYESRNFRDPN